MPLIPDFRPPQETRRQRAQRQPPTGQRACAPAASCLARYCPIKATPKQDQFLKLKCQEGFYGGAAGGGKSTALLMGALEHADVPGHAALILRRDTQRLHLAGGLIPRSHEWLTGKAQWNARRCQWVFPTGGPPATITFGYLMSPLDKFRYGSSEYQYIAFDELTEFAEEDYLFLFSRLRRTRGFDVPLRMRSASNPGGPGHLWVKARFIDQADERYIPAGIGDNPHLDGDEYRQSLMHLPPVTRERLLNGDWSVRADGQFREESLRYYLEVDGELHILEPTGKVMAAAMEKTCDRFATIDPASTPAEMAQASGRPHSYSVIQVWDQPRGPLARFLFLRHVWRKQVGIVELLSAICDIQARWQPQAIYVEKERLGTAVCDLSKLDGIRLTPIPPAGKDKKTRAQPLIVKFSDGEILLPKHNNSWRPEFEAELLHWTGDKREPCDQIDAAAYAAIIAQRNRPREAYVLDRVGL